MAAIPFAMNNRCAVTSCALNSLTQPPRGSQFRAQFYVVEITAVVIMGRPITESGAFKRRKEARHHILEKNREENEDALTSGQMGMDARRCSIIQIPTSQCPCLLL
jgi:hypothetical protein